MKGVKSVGNVSIVSRRDWLRAFRGTTVVAMSLLLESCSPAGNLLPLPDYKSPAYRLGAGDQVRIITFGEQQLTGEFRVDDQGRLGLPLLGPVQAAGLTTRELEVNITNDLRKRELLSDASVAAEVLTYRPIFVLGEVAKPGQYPYQPGMTMLTSVAIAGGFTYRAVEDYGEVIRTTGGVAQDGLVQPSSFIAPGDVVKIFERRF